MCFQRHFLWFGFNIEGKKAFSTNIWSKSSLWFWSPFSLLCRKYWGLAHIKCLLRIRTLSLSLSHTQTHAHTLHIFFDNRSKLSTQLGTQILREWKTRPTLTCTHTHSHSHSHSNSNSHSHSHSHSHAHAHAHTHTHTHTRTLSIILEL